MYEFHGWCALVKSTDEYDTEKLTEVVEELQVFIAKLNWPNGFCELRGFNGEYFVHFGGYQNRPRETAAEIDALLKLISEMAPGSFGLFYWIDDENPAPPGQLGWRVQVIARGRIETRFDPFLSPTVPLIED